MEQLNTTQAETLWANAGLYPSEEAIRDHLLIGLLQEGAPIPPDYPELLEAAGIRFNGSLFGLIEFQVVAVDAWSLVRGLGHTAYSEAHLVVNLLELFRDCLKNQPDTLVFKVQSDLKCIVTGNTVAETGQRLLEVAEELLHAADAVNGIRLFAAVSRVRPGYESLGLAREEVRECQEYRMMHLCPDRILTTAVLEQPTIRGEESPDIRKEHEMLAAFRAGNFREAAARLDSLFECEYLQLAHPLILLKHKCIRLLDSVLRISEEILQEELSAALDELRPEQRLLAATTYPEVRAHMGHILGNLNDLALASGKTAGVDKITEVKNYIRANYNDPDLNVNYIADYFERNPSYLSRSFHRATGTGILDYIHRYRIQEAKILIGRGETIASAAAAVGYSNVLTMSRAFKKYEGTTPGRLKG